MLLRDDTRNHWYRVGKLGDRNRPETAWFGVGCASSHGKFVVRPITAEGRLAMIASIVVWALASIGIWVFGYGLGTYSFAFAITATVLIATIVMAALFRLIVGRMTRLPPPPAQSR